MSDRETLKRWFREYGGLREYEEVLISHIAELRGDAGRRRRPRRAEDVRYINRRSDLTANTATDIVVLEQRLSEIRAARLKRHHAILIAVDLLSATDAGKELWDILLLRYVNKKTWPDIARIEAKSIASCKRMCDKGLKLLLSSNRIQELLKTKVGA